MRPFSLVGFIALWFKFGRNERGTDMGLIKSINGKLVEHTHKLTEKRETESVLVRCSCGWWHRTKTSNATKREKAKQDHLQEHAA
jgi:hypothetical protein